MLFRIIRSHKTHPSIDELIFLAKNRYPDANRIALFQFNNVLQEWDHIIQSQRELEKVQKDAAYVLLPTLTSYVTEAERQPSPLTTKNINKLSRQINAEGMLRYSYWLLDEMEAAMATFRPTDADEYTLQGLMVDFRHEVTSPLMKNYQGQLEEAHALNPEDGLIQRLEAEKKKIVARDGILESLESQRQILERIVAAISSILAMHPNLLELTVSCRYFALFLKFSAADWIEAVLLSLLLNDALGVVTCLYSWGGPEKVAWPYALSLSFLQLSKNHSRDELERLLNNWENPSLEQMLSQLREQILLVLKSEKNLKSERPKGDQILFPNPTFLKLVPQTPDSDFLQEML